MLTAVITTKGCSNFTELIRFRKQNKKTYDSYAVKGQIANRSKSMRISDTDKEHLQLFARASIQLKLCDTYVCGL